MARQAATPRFWLFIQPESKARGPAKQPTESDFRLQLQPKLGGSVLAQSPKPEQSLGVISCSTFRAGVQSPSGTSTPDLCPLSLQPAL